LCGVDELGHEAAAWDLACCVAEKQNSYKPAGRELNYAIDWSLAVPLYEAYASVGHPIAQKDLGTCYFHGWGVAKSIDQAAAFYEEAALQNNNCAQYNLGICYW
jgi:TPR repeat protein